MQGRQRGLVHESPAWFPLTRNHYFTPSPSPEISFSLVVTSVSECSHDLGGGGGGQGDGQVAGGSPRNFSMLLRKPAIVTKVFSSSHSSRSEFSTS